MNMIITYIVKENLQNVPLKNYCKNLCNISTGLWRRIKWNGTVSINDNFVRPTIAVVNKGDFIKINLPEESHILPIYQPLDIRFENEALIVINKPSNMLVHPTAGDNTNTLGNALLYYYNETNQKIDFHPVHRLDRNTTGLVLIAKLPQLQYRLTQGIGKNKETSSKLFKRTYLAIVEGQLEKNIGTINLPIVRHPNSIIQRICTQDGTGQRAITHYRVLSYSNGRSLIELELETGRTHQIRVHLASIGHPIIGDDLYGGNTRLIKRQALHAYHLEIDNPLNKEKYSIYAPIPMDMRKILQLTQ